MTRAINTKRGVVVALAAGAAALLTSTLATTNASAQVATHPSARAGASHASATNGASRVGRFSGIVHAVSPTTGRAAHAATIPGASNASDPAIGTPPLIYHGGPVMATRSTGPLMVTPIFWNPAGHPIDAGYKNILDTYLSDVSKDSGKSTNVYSTLNEYYGSNGAIRYKVQMHKAINDTSALPADGCTVAPNDTTGIYADNTGYDACLDDNQIIAETNQVVASRGLPVDYQNIYVMFLPKHVESCFFAGSTTTAANACTINHNPSAAYCAYHSQASNGTVYANMPFPIYFSSAGYTCGSNAHGHKIIESPNGNPDADTEISPTSHEIMEAATDPDTATGWYDSSGYENGDECAYVYGTMSGVAGSRYNQVINGHRYLTQEEFSNKDFAATGNGCLQNTSS